MAAARDQENGNSLVIRADASVTTGIGHVMRCLALAQAWLDVGGAVYFVATLDSPAVEQRLVREGVHVSAPAGGPGSPEDADGVRRLAQEVGAQWIAVDGYHYTPEFRDGLRVGGQRLLIIDDNGDNPPYRADAILNQNSHADERIYPDAGTDTTVLLGTRYTMLRREFTAASDNRSPAKSRVTRALVVMGGSDPNNATLRVLEALNLAFDISTHCDVIVGAANPHRDTLVAYSAETRFDVHLLTDPADLAARMAQAELAISAGGSTLWELCHLRVPTIAVAVADNQRPAVTHLSEAGAVIDGTEALATSTVEFSELVEKVGADPVLRQTTAETAGRLVDGLGAFRVVAALQGPMASR